MHINVQIRFNPATGDMVPYYRIRESYRDVRGHIYSPILLNIRFEPSLTAVQVRKIAYVLTEHFKNRSTPSLFKECLEGLTFIEQAKAGEWWSRMKREGGIDRLNKEEQRPLRKYENYIDLETADYTDVRNVGTEWLCKQTIDKLQLEGLLRKSGWTENAIHTALSTLIARKVYAVSERSSYYYSRDNSAAVELYSGALSWTPGTNSLYKITDKLYELKEQLEHHLRSATDDLFNIDNELMLLDLTNFYLEGSKRNSDKAKFGCSKEKRSDCKLLVFALCINKEGFIRYPSTLEGNIVDPKSLPNIIDTLAKRNPSRTKDTFAIMDPGVAMEENLELIKKRGYNYLCVSRTQMKDYTFSDDNKSVTVMGAHRQKITLKEVKAEDDRDHHLEIIPSSEAMTESPMNRVREERFGMELQRINDGISKKGGTKTYEKVVERTGRAIQEYPSITKFYQMGYIKNEKKPKEMLRIDWEIKDLSAMEPGHGVHSLRSNVGTLSERVTWEYYNLIREIERTDRQPKDKPDLRPIYHQKGERSDAHLFFGLLAYWVVNTIRCQLKREGESCYWIEIVRRISTQKLVTTKGKSPLGETIEMRQCSNSSKQAKQIYDKLNLKHLLSKKNEACRTQSP